MATESGSLPATYRPLLYRAIGALENCDMKTARETVYRLTGFPNYEAQLWTAYLRLRLDLEGYDARAIAESRAQFYRLYQENPHPVSAEAYHMAAVIDYLEVGPNCRRLLKLSYREAKKVNDTQMMGKSLYLYAMALTRTGEAHRSRLIAELAESKYGKELRPQLRSAVYLVLAVCCSRMGEGEQAMEYFKKANWYLCGAQSAYYQIMLNQYLADEYLRRGEKEVAQRVLERSPPWFLERSRMLKHYQTEMEQRIHGNLNEVVLRLESKTLEVPGKLPVNLRNQHVMIRLLQTLMSEPGREFSKEELISKVWTEKYNPLTHDNKIYFTINRCRFLLEKDPKKPHFLQKGWSGYFWNKSCPTKIS